MDDAKNPYGSDFFYYVLVEARLRFLLYSLSLLSLLLLSLFLVFCSSSFSLFFFALDEELVVD